MPMNQFPFSGHGITIEIRLNKEPSRKQRAIEGRRRTPCDGSKKQLPLRYAHPDKQVVRATQTVRCKRRGIKPQKIESAKTVNTSALVAFFFFTGGF